MQDERLRPPPPVAAEVGSSEPVASEIPEPVAEETAEEEIEEEQTTGNSEPSHVLLAMGLSEQQARTSLRLTVGRSNTSEQIEEVVDALAETVERLREMAAVRQ